MVRAHQLVDSHTLNHDNFQVFREKGVPSTAWVGEVLAVTRGPYNSESSRENALQQWLNSPEHSQILLSDRYNYFGSAELPWYGRDQEGMWYSPEWHLVLYVGALIS